MTDKIKKLYESLAKALAESGDLYSLWPDGETEVYLSVKVRSIEVSDNVIKMVAYMKARGKGGGRRFRAVCLPFRFDLTQKGWTPVTPPDKGLPMVHDYLATKLASNLGGLPSLERLL